MSQGRASRRTSTQRARPGEKNPGAKRASTEPTPAIETFPNPAPERDYEIAFDCPEFTCLCPLTGQPDFATIHISYVPGESCVELKSLKLYLWSYRDEGTFHEAVTNRILDDLVEAVGPRRMT
ncbi:MAG: preQ(1) synthase, partial [bacterium]